MCLPSVVVVVVAPAAAGEELVLVDHHLILLLKAHSPNLRHNNIKHREIAGSSPTFFTTFLFFCVRELFFLSVINAHDRGVLDVCKHAPHTICITLFLFPRGVLFFLVVFVSNRSVASHFFFNNLVIFCLGTLDHFSSRQRSTVFVPAVFIF